MSGVVLYDNSRSSNALKVRFLLAELALPYERREVPLRRPRPAEYLALNPVGGIPALVDGALVVSESHAILRYLAAREGRDDLLPSAPGERAVVDEFLDRFATGLRAAFRRHEILALGFPPELGATEPVPRDPEGAARVETEIQPAIRLIDRLVEPVGAVLGRFTIADCALAPTLFRTTLTGLDLGPYPRVSALRERLLTRPAWAAAGPVS